ncbi:MAG TPA: hypothetical protein DEA55_06015 [Rhodospirillaceae bacterium]|nr:hypothetical protein [Rhodospirillaceae bacterium]
MSKLLPDKREPTHKIQNRDGHELAVWVDEVPDSRSVFYGQHGMFEGALAHINQKAAEALQVSGFSTVFFDAANHGNYSGGKAENLTWDSHFADLDTVIEWGQRQEWASPRYGLYGRSLGATSAFWHAAHNPEKVEVVIGLTVPVSGEKLWSAFDRATNGGWKKYRVLLSRNSVNGKHIDIVFDSEGKSHKYNLLDHAHKITGPVLLMAGTEDKYVGIGDIEELFSKIPHHDKEKVIMQGQDHFMLKDRRNFPLGEANEEALSFICNSIQRWLEKIKMNGQAFAPSRPSPG